MTGKFEILQDIDSVDMPVTPSSVLHECKNLILFSSAWIIINDLIILAVKSMFKGRQLD